MQNAQWLGVVVPGLGNLHSHAFQRAMAELTETGGASGDSFWSWRALMYRFLEYLQPDDVEAIAGLAYMEMLESGFTRVGEFHYLHHAADGRAYADRAEMAARIAAAADTSRIGLTLLPVFYAHSDFGGAPPLPQQRRFVHDMDDFQRLLERCRTLLTDLPDAVLGLAPHSLRAVTPDELQALVDMADGPIHIHIAEQIREVEACTAWSGQRPLAWLMEHSPVDARWCLVHATHVEAAEVQGITASGAVVGLCPITEANLGDGVFPMRELTRAGGRFGVGSDSNVLIDAAEELRLAEYAQRLAHRARNVLAPDGVSSGRWLYQQAQTGAAQALGVAPGLAIGAPADLVELDPDHPALHARHGDALIDSWLFAAAARSAVRSVWRGGHWRPGDRIPSEHALMAQYACLRPPGRPMSAGVGAAHDQSHCRSRSAGGGFFRSPARKLTAPAPWTRTEHRISAAPATPDQAARLDVRPGSACLRIERRTWRGEQPITWVRQWFPGDAYELTARFSPGGGSS